VEITVRIDGQAAPADQATEIAKQIAIAADRAATHAENRVWATAKTTERHRAVALLRGFVDEARQRRKPFDVEMCARAIAGDGPPEESAWRLLTPAPPATARR